MKRIRHDGLSLVTGTQAADAFVSYASEAMSRGAAVAVDLPVLEENGRVVQHTLLFGPAVVLDVVDVDGLTDADEADVFPTPEFPPLRTSGLALEPDEIPDLVWGEMTERPI